MRQSARLRVDQTHTHQLTPHLHHPPDPNHPPQRQYRRLMEMYGSLKSQKIGQLEALVEEQDQTLTAVREEVKRSEEFWKREAKMQRQAAASVQAEQTQRRMKFMQVRGCGGGWLWGLLGFGRARGGRVVNRRGRCTAGSLACMTSTPPHNTPHTPTHTTTHHTYTHTNTHPATPHPHRHTHQDELAKAKEAVLEAEKAVKLREVELIERDRKVRGRRR